MNLNTADYIALGIVVTLAVIAIIYVVRQKKKGKCIGCSCDCSHCSGCNK